MKCRRPGRCRRGGCAVHSVPLAHLSLQVVPLPDDQRVLFPAENMTCSYDVMEWFSVLLCSSFPSRPPFFTL